MAFKWLRNMHSGLKSYATTKCTEPTALKTRCTYRFSGFQSAGNDVLVEDGEP